METTLASGLNELGAYYKDNHIRPNPAKTQLTAFHLKNRQADRKLNVTRNVTLTHQPPSAFCNSSRVTAFALIIAVNIGLVRLPRFAAEIFPQLCSADVLAVSTVSSSFTVVCLAGLPRFRLTATLCPTGFSACVLGNSMLVCFDMVGSALSHFSCDETNDDICRVPVL